MRGNCLALLLMVCATAASAEDDAPPVRHFTNDEISAIAMPILAFEADGDDLKNYDKYFYFHRPNTSFDEAFADIVECDSLASGFTYYANSSYATSSAFASYGLLPSALGSAIGAAIADAIFGSAERRRERRMNLRNCMHYKDYNRYGLDKDLWQEFNFEEGNDRVEPKERERYLKLEARVASGLVPAGEVLEP